MSDKRNESKPTVLIVGAGLGGLLLGALLEKADIPYVIFERAKTVKTLGSALLISPSMMPVLDQLGVLEEFMALGKPTMECTISRESTKLFVIPYHSQVEYTGYYSYIISRPLFVELLLKLVPPHKILYGKRALIIKEEDDKVNIQTADNCIYEGDILVGADGAYSAVRQRLYERLKKEGKLPDSDQEELPFNSTCLFGQTGIVDYADFPEFQKPVVSFYSQMGDHQPYTYAVFATSQSTMCWMVIHHLDKKAGKAAEEHRFRESENSQWGSYAAHTMCDETRHLPLSIGTKKVTMGDIYDWTPKDEISKAMLEEKVFHTWYSGRTVLLGDACHKLNPAGAQGAITAMQDAIAIANLLYALPSNTSKEVEKAFAEYRAERYEPAVDAFYSSKGLATYSEGGVLGSIALFIMGRLPSWVINLATRKMILHRSQVGFRPMIENKGSVPALVSPSTEKAKAIYEERNESISVSVGSEPKQ
ncbi:hypothetical protein BGX23_009652 [Mortierella sp. AD031]|nr:hypothetical protein BGX23_009652 [Mortierella sp. AD031]